MYPSIWQILIVLLILLLLFGHKKVREFGKSLGEALRDFKKGLEGNTEKPDSPESTSVTSANPSNDTPENTITEENKS